MPTVSCVGLLACHLYHLVSILKVHIHICIYMHIYAYCQLYQCCCLVSCILDAHQPGLTTYCTASLLFYIVAIATWVPFGLLRCPWNTNTARAIPQTGSSLASVEHPWVFLNF